MGLSREYLIKGLGDKDVKAYLDYQVGLATLLGADKDSATKQQTEALEFEIKLANVILLFQSLFSPFNPSTVYYVLKEKGGIINFDCYTLPPK